MFSNNRDELRQFYINSWQKFQSKQALNPLEQQIVAVIQEHPEYHTSLEKNHTIQQDYFPEMGETNPYLHMGMHLGLREQLSTNRPDGIQTIYQQLQKKYGNHEAEHQMMECLAEAIWSAQKNNTMPDEVAYLECMKGRM